MTHLIINSLSLHIKNKVFKFISPDNIKSLCLYLSDEKRSIDYYVWKFYDQQSEWITETLRPLFLALEFKKSDHRLIKTGKQSYLFKGDNVNLNRLEILLHLLIQTKLNGQIFIPNTLKYRHLSDDLINDKDWKQKSKLIKSSQLKRLSMQPQKLMASLEKELVDKIDHVGLRIQNGDNKTVIMRNRSGNTKWRLPYKGVGNILNSPFFEQLKQVHISDLLRFINKEISFLKAFEPLRHTQSYYIRLETLNHAHDIISNAIAKLPIFEHYNIQDSTLHASVDSQKFECRMNTFKTRYSSKYFGTNKGVSAMTLVVIMCRLNLH